MVTCRLDVGAGACHVVSFAYRYFWLQILFLLLILAQKFLGFRSDL